MPSCAVYGCKNYSRRTKGSDIRYYRFPKDKKLSKQWVHACHRQDKINVKNGAICCKHFQPDAFMRSLKHELLHYYPRTFRSLKKDAIPTAFLPNQKPSVITDRSVRYQKRDEIKNRSIIIREILENAENAPDQMKCTKQDKKQSSATSMKPSISELRLVSESDVSLYLLPETFKCKYKLILLSENAHKNKLLEQLKIENTNLRKQNEILQQNLTSASTELESMKTKLKKHCGPGQIKRDEKNSLTNRRYHVRNVILVVYHPVSTQ